MTKMAAMPIYGKTFKNLLLWNQKADDLDTLYAALVTRVLPSFFQMMTLVWPWPILQRGQMWSLLFLYGKMLKLDFQETIEACKVIVGRYSQINEYMTMYDNTRSRSFIDLCPRSLRSLRFNIFKHLSMFRVTWPRWLPGPYMIKPFKNLLLRNQEADNIETWYTASGTQVLPNLFKWWHWIDLDHFYDMVKFVS